MQAGTSQAPAIPGQLTLLSEALLPISAPRKTVGELGCEGETAGPLSPAAGNALKALRK